MDQQKFQPGDRVAYVSDGATGTVQRRQQGMTGQGPREAWYEVAWDDEPTETAPVRESDLAPANPSADECPVCDGYPLGHLYTATGEVCTFRRQ